MGDLHKFKALLLVKGLVLFLCILWCDSEQEILIREPTHLAADYYLFL